MAKDPALLKDVIKNELPYRLIDQVGQYAAYDDVPVIGFFFEEL